MGACVRTVGGDGWRWGAYVCVYVCVCMIVCVCAKEHVRVAEVLAYFPPISFVSVQQLPWICG